MGTRVRSYLVNGILNSFIGAHVVTNDIEEHGVRHGENEALASGVLRYARESVCNNISLSGLVLDGIIITQELRQINLLLWRLYDLVHEFR